MQGVGFKALFLVAIALLSFGFLSWVDAQENHVAVSDKGGPDFRAQVEKETFILINKYRMDYGLPALTWSEAIAKEARGHSKDMATGEVDFGHDGFSDRVDRLRGVITGVSGAGENVLYTSELDRVAQSAVTMWLHSPHHLKNIRGDYNYSGLGVWQDKDGTLYFTQIFVDVKPPKQEPTASVEPGVVTPFGFLATPIVSKTR